MLRADDRIRRWWYARQARPVSNASESSNLQRGRIFTRIPAAWPQRVHARSYCFARPRPCLCNRMREESILIVEDNEDFRGLVRIALEQEGFTVREARDGREALDTLQESGSSHCLMLMDLMMPGMTCWELVSAVRGDPLLRNNPIIVTTVAPEDAPSGIDAILAKPFGLDSNCAVQHKAGAPV